MIVNTMKGILADMEAQAVLMEWQGQLEDAIDAHTAQMREVETALAQLDSLAEVWGDEGVFRRCRDRLRATLTM